MPFFSSNRKPQNNLSTKILCVKKHADPCVDYHADSQLELEMGPKPGPDWGTEEEDQPVSAITGEMILPLPVITAPSPTFSTALEITITSLAAESSLVYTLDGSEPNQHSARYLAPFTLTETTTVRAMAISPQGLRSQVVRARFQRIHTEWSIEILSTVNRQYTAGGPEGLIDGLRGHENFRLGGWQGYQDQDFVGTVDLGQIKPIQHVAAGFLQDTGSWILMPRQVEFWLSDDGEHFSLAGTVNHQVPDTATSPLRLDMELKLKSKARYVKLIARKYGALPDWHLGSGHPAFIFIDEIIIE